MATTGCGSLAAGANITGSNPATANMTTPWIGQFPFPEREYCGQQLHVSGQRVCGTTNGQIRWTIPFGVGHVFLALHAERTHACHPLQQPELH